MQVDYVTPNGEKVHFSGVYAVSNAFRAVSVPPAQLAASPSPAPPMGVPLRGSDPTSCALPTLAVWGRLKTRTPSRAWTWSFESFPARTVPAGPDSR